MDDAVRDLQARLERLEQAVERLRTAAVVRDEGVTRVTAPFQVVDTAGSIVLEVADDTDGGYLVLSDDAGRTSVVLGCIPSGGFIDILHRGGDKLDITLVATDDGGRIEVTDKNGNEVFIIPADRGA